MSWMLAPLGMCLVLTGIHGYLGLHVLSRKVIFVDLALAQIAALGTTYAFVLGYDAGRPEDTGAVYAFSLAFSVLGAAVFAIARTRSERVPQEAFIGIVYAAASALAVLWMARAPGEGEHLKQMLVGNILLVTWPQVLKTAAIYAAVGAVHVALRRPFWEISTDPEAAAARGRHVRRWDFLFYVTFGVVITSSVAIAGVLLVFTYLVVPAAIALLLCGSLRARMAVAWAAGAIASAAGIALSYFRDLPTGPSVVTCFAVLLVMVAAARSVVRAPGWGAWARVAAGAGALALLVVGARALRRDDTPHAHEEEFARLAEALRSPNDDVVVEAIHHLEEGGDPHAGDLLLERLAAPASDRVIEHLADGLARVGERRAVPALVGLLAGDLDPYLRLDLARALLDLRSAEGFGAILAALDSAEATVLSDREAAALLARFAGDDRGLAAAGDPAVRAQAVARLRSWWLSRRDTLRWREERRRFE
jgi:zinc/manganese transport system permease protein